MRNAIVPPVLCLAGALAAAPAQQRLQAQPKPAASSSALPDDARRAAATRLLAASRFRERQAVQATDVLRAARADLTEDCVTRAAEGRSLRDCRATAVPEGAVARRLAASRSDLLDEVMAASQTIYARRFTAAEMDEITRFFRTPVGRKYALEYTRVLDEVGERRRAIARRYLVEAARGARAGS